LQFSNDGYRTLGDGRCGSDECVFRIDSGPNDLLWLCGQPLRREWTGLEAASPRLATRDTAQNLVDGNSGPELRHGRALVHKEALAIFYFPFCYVGPSQLCRRATIPSKPFLAFTTPEAFGWASNKNPEACVSSLATMQEGENSAEIHYRTRDHRAGGTAAERIASRRAEIVWRSG
jgi:hypothetical protein